MLSRVHFEIEHDGRKYTGSVMVKQIAGGSFQNDPLEVGSVEYPRDAPQFQYEEFRDRVEACYRRVVRPFLAVQSLHMANNRFDLEPERFEVEAAQSARGPW